MFSKPNTITYDYNMSNWLDQAESRAVIIDDQSSLQDKLLLKEEAIQKNYLDHQLPFDDFIAELEKLVNRVNDLSMAYRQPFGKISLHSKDSRLDNHLHYISSSNRIKNEITVRCRKFCSSF